MHSLLGRNKPFLRKMKKILITGANGQLGNEMRVLFDSYPQFEFFPTDIEELDLCNRQAIDDFITENKINYIVNCAAYTAVDKAEDDIDLCYKINVDAVGNLAKAANGRAKIIHVSTDYAFDGQAKRPYKETDLTNPQSVYGKSKKAGEDTLLENCSNSIIIRTAWLYSSFGSNFVKTMMRLGREKDTLNVVSDQIGTPTYAADLAKAMMDIIVYCEEKQSFPAGIYHYSNEGICSWYDFTLKIHELAGIATCKVNPITTEQYPTKAKRPMYSVLDKSKIKETFGLEIPEWETSLKKCIFKD